MKVLVAFALLLASVNASKLAGLIPSFATGYIIHGEDATPHSAPYIISLSPYSDRHAHTCGGTIISKDWVLTAAHCITVNPVGMGVLAGLHNRLDVDEKTQLRVVDFGRVHEHFVTAVGPDDIAILHVSQPFEFNEWVQSAVLPRREEIHSGSTHLYGWGKPTAYSYNPAVVLQTVETDIVEWNACKEMLPDDALFYESNLCSDSQQKGISACNGDSGGPLVKETPNTTSELVGIVSWGYLPCGVANMPSIYTRVSAYVDWVVKIQNAYYVLFK